MRHVLSIADLSSQEVREILDIGRDLKEKYKQGVREALFPGKVLALVFEKPSLRTRVSFESAMAHLGGTTLFLGEDVGWGQRESTADFSRVLSGYVDLIVCRAKSHVTVEALAGYSSCPVINGLTDLSHPCQALADMMTIRERHGGLEGVKLAYIGDANNVARSLVVASAKLGVEMVIAAPKAYQFDEKTMADFYEDWPNVKIVQTEDPREAIKNADAVYTDVWASMGQESEAAIRKQAFAEYQVNEELMKLAHAKACFLHCLPARRGEEVTDAVMDGPQSAVIQQAGNRMHAQKGLLVWLLQQAS
ncbi:MAG: ornithine carbamoyltransferase [bacterium]|nr:ornithine carbamoyltransferase [bacterium]